MAETGTTGGPAVRRLAGRVVRALRERGQGAGDDTVPADPRMAAPIVLEAGWSEGLFDALAERYVTLLLRCLTRTGFGEPHPEAPWAEGLEPELSSRVDAHLAERGLIVVRRDPPDPAERAVGLDWPTEAETMIGMQRLMHLARTVAAVVHDGVPGDVLEAGVWRGGACILMRGVLAALDAGDRRVWVADSFAGLPKPDAERYPADEGDRHWTFTELAVGLEAVRANFARYELLDDQVRFLEGWFEDTLPGAPFERLAVLRVDGDMYGSTMQVLESCYPKLSIGGYCIIDDYGAVEGCRRAVADYRDAHGIDEPMEEIDWTGRVWRRSH